LFFGIDKAPLSDLAEHYVKQIQSVKAFENVNSQSQQASQNEAKIEKKRD
jgi:hypothetical protein